MSNYNDALIQELHACAAELTKIANSDSADLEKMASVTTAPVSSERTDYLAGVMSGLGLRY